MNRLQLAFNTPCETSDAPKIGCFTSVHGNSIIFTELTKLFLSEPLIHKGRKNHEQETIING
jgi:hypothetical protein